MSKTREQLLSGLSKINRILVEANEPIEFRETLEVSGDAASRLVKEAVDGTLGLCPLGRAGSPPNGNGRIYPEEQFAVAVERSQEKIQAGLFRGAIDHPGYSDGMKSSPILWRHIEFDGNKNMLMGRPHIVSDHSMGKDLIALLKAGSGLAFSTRGRGSAHFPSEEEKKRYHLKDGDDDGVVIIDDYELIAIDVVDNPSCKEAVVPGSAPSASQSGRKQDSRESDTQETLTMKTLAEVQAQNPSLWNEIQAAQTAAVAAAVKPLNEQITALKPKAEAHDKLVSHLNPFVSGLKDHSGVSIPERQVSADEDRIKLEKANGQVTELTAKLETATGEVSTLKQQIESDKAARLAEKANAERMAKASVKLEACLKESKYADEIRAIAEEEKVLEKADFDEAAAENFVKLHTERFDKIAGKTGQTSKWFGVSKSKDAADESGKKNAGFMGTLAQGAAF